MNPTNMVDDGTDVPKDLLWAMVRLRRDQKGFYREMARLRRRGRPPVRQWQGATVAGGVPKEGLPEAASEWLLESSAPTTRLVHSLHSSWLGPSVTCEPDTIQ